MKDIDRRKFLKSLFVGSGALLMPSVILGAAGNSVAGTSVSSVDPALIRQAKQAFYRKNYELAEILYKQLIALEPDNVTHYDGLRKVYGAQQQLFPIASLYKQGLSKNPNQAVFYDRLARSVKTVAMGSQQEEKLYKGKFGSEDLLLAALGIYIMAIPKFPDDKSLRLGLKDVARSFDVRKALKKLNDKLPATLTANIQKHLASVKDGRGKPKNTRGVSVEETVTSKIARMEVKKRRELYFDKEKENRQTTMLKQKKYWQTQQIEDSFASGNISQAKQQIKKVLQENSEETHLVGALKKQARKAKDKHIVIDFYEEQYKTKKDFWTIIGYATILRKQHPQQNFTKIMSLYEKAGTLVSNSGKEVEALYGGRTLAYFETGKFAECRREALKAMEITNGCGNISLKLSINYAKSYAGENDYATALGLLKMLKRESEDVNGEIENTIVRYLQPDQTRDEEIYMMQRLFPHERTKTEKLDVLYAMAKIQHKQGDRVALRQTLEEIKAIEPNNQFILKFA